MTKLAQPIVMLPPAEVIVPAMFPVAPAAMLSIVEHPT